MKNTAIFAYMAASAALVSAGGGGDWETKVDTVYPVHTSTSSVAPISTSTLTSTKTWYPTSVETKTTTTTEYPSKTKTHTYVPPPPPPPPPPHSWSSKEDCTTEITTIITTTAYPVTTVPYVPAPPPVVYPTSKNHTTLRPTGTGTWNPPPQTPVPAGAVHNSAAGGALAVVVFVAAYLL